ncbi:MAG: DUF374 domain-containing protein [Alphaproteobacteria bacterium]|nr:DUF374 domain-containing protein [Alphaproteobacteria bacterium]
MKKLWREIEWYDIKTFARKLLRKVAYSWLVQELICGLFLAYMWLVYVSSKKIFVNYDTLLTATKSKSPIILSFWHNRLMMIPFITRQPKKISPDYNFMTLASRHGDGRFVGKIMEKFGLISIYGSSKDGRKSSRGIDVGSFKRIFDGLKKGFSFGVTPDGPRGPNQKINGEIINIARISGAGILPISYSCSCFKQINTWDKFKIPLPFSTLCFYFNEKPFLVARNADMQEMEELKNVIAERMNLVQQKADSLANRHCEEGKARRSNLILICKRIASRCSSRNDEVGLR